MKRYTISLSSLQKTTATVAAAAMLAMAAPAYAGDNQSMPTPGITKGFGPLYKGAQPPAPTSSKQGEGLSLGEGLALLGIGFTLWCVTAGCTDSPEEAEARQRAEAERDSRMAEQAFQWIMGQ